VKGEEMLAKLKAFAKSSMFRYIVRRLLYMIPVALGISIIVFLTMYAAGDPITLKKQQTNLRLLLAKIKSLKEQGYDITDLSEYLDDVQLAHKDLPMKHKCAAGKNVLLIDTNLDVFPCFKRRKMFNLKTDEFKLITHECPIDDKNCLTTCFKEPSIVSGRQILSLLKSEGRNIRTYMRYVKGPRE
jgi:hypothetical protein